jgi:hypothetical protein
MASRAHLDKWGYERTGYDNRPTVAYAGNGQRASEAGIHWTSWERRLATLALLGATCWAARIVRPDEHNIAALWETPGPLETCGISALLWLHAWWRSTVKLK